MKYYLKAIYYSLVKHLRVQGHVKIGKRFQILQGSIVNAPNGLTIGNDTYIGRNCSIICDGCIGNFVLISDSVGIVGKYDHDLKEIGTPIRYAKWVGDEDYSLSPSKLGISIEDDVWIGFGAIILSGIKIGKGAVIGAGSLVLNDVAPYSIVVGSPAKEVSKRFSDLKQIAEHEEKIKNFQK